MACLTCGQPFRTTLTGAPPAKKSSSLVWWLVGGGVLLFIVVLVGLGITLLVASGVFGDDPTPKAKGPVTPAPIVPAAPAPEASSAGSSSVIAKAPLSDAQRDDLPGEYTCSLDDTPAFRCRVSGGILEKLDGSQRFRGPVTKLPDGNLAFSGTFFCPFGACTHSVATTFIRQGPGRYVGRFAPTNAPGAGGGNERVVLTKVR
jgi:hypothetical protein